MKTAQELTDTLKKILSENLVSVVLYGSTVAQDHAQYFSNVNVLVVTQRLDQPTLQQLMPVVKEWLRAGHKTPHFLTEKMIQSSTDVFPLEFSDIKAVHQVLYGADIFSALSIQLTNLQHQLEFELRGKLLQLQQRYIETQGKAEAVKELMAKSLSSFTVLFKGILLLMNKPVPTHKKDVWVALAEQVSFDRLVWEKIWGLRHGIPFEQADKVDDLFSRYQTSIEVVIDFVDKN